MPGNLSDLYKDEARIPAGQPSAPPPLIHGGQATPPGYNQAVQRNPIDPTLDEHIRMAIMECQAQIKSLESKYFEAKQLGILNVKVSKLRDYLGW